MSRADGNIGCNVPRRGSVVQGILTAGHVAGPVGAPVTSGTDDVGVVIFSENPAENGGMAASVDVAVIATRDSKPEYTGIPAIIGTAAGRVDQIVTVYGRNRITGTLLAFCSVLRISGGITIDCWMTSQAISGAGDSGAPVLVPEPELEGDFGSILGHVIGGAPGVTTFIQDIHTQLSAARAELLVL